MTDVKRYDVESGNEHGAGIYCDVDGDYVLFDDYQELQDKNEDFIQRQQFRVEQLERDNRNLEAIVRKLKLQKTEIMKGVSDFQQMEVVAENKLKVDAVRKAADWLLLTSDKASYDLELESNMELCVDLLRGYANTLEAGENYV